MNSSLLLNPAIVVATLFAFNDRASLPTLGDDLKTRELVVDVRTFGAKGDGESDDTSAIQAAIFRAYTNPKESNRPNAKVVGDIVYFPPGRYLIKDTLQVPVGVTLRGAQSGLIAQSGAGTSSGTVLSLATTKANGRPWTHATMFNLLDGGPIQFEALGFIGTSTVTDSTCIQSGSLNANTGITQARFEGCRFLAFTRAFRAYKLNDATFHNCGFESNIIDFEVRESASSPGGMTGNFFTGCVFFGHQIGFQIGSNAKFVRNVFSACTFQSVDAGTGKNAITNNASTGGTIRDNSFSACAFHYNKGHAINLFTGNTFTSGNTFSGCIFDQASFRAHYTGDRRVSNFKDMLITGSTFRNSHIDVSYEAENVSIIGNQFLQESPVRFVGPKGLNLTGNSFFGTTNVGADVAIQDIASDFSIIGNIFRKGFGGIGQLHPDCVRFKVMGNVNQPDR